MSLLALPENVDTVILPLPHVLARPDMGAAVEGRRMVYFETSREGVVDREGEDIAADALWASRKLFLDQANFDISHFSWIGNPVGTGMRPEYVIGHPTDVKRRGPSIWVEGEIYSSLTPPPEGGSGWWANEFWHSISALRPPKKWFPSVFGKMSPGGVEMQVRKGKTVRLIKGPMAWFSVGFAQRAQHPALGPISSTPVGPFGGNIIAKAVNTGRNVVQDNIAVLNLETFAKAVTAAGDVGGGAGLTGVPAVRREALEQTPRTLTDLYAKTKPGVMRLIIKGKIEGTLRATAEAFKRAGVPESHAARFAERLGREVDAQTLKFKGH